LPLKQQITNRKTNITVLIFVNYFASATATELVSLSATCFHTDGPSSGSFHDILLIIKKAG
jgi:hypothetical protein